MVCEGQMTTSGMTVKQVRYLILENEIAPIWREGVMAELTGRVKVMQSIGIE